MKKSILNLKQILQVVMFTGYFMESIYTSKKTQNKQQ